MDYRWRPIQDESALNSVAGSRMGSDVGGPRTSRGDRNRPTRTGTTTTAGPSSRAHHDDTGTSRGGALTQRDSQRTTTTGTTRDESDYFRRPSMRNTASMSQMSDTSSLAQRWGTI